MFSNELLAAGFSAVLNKKVMTQAQFTEFKKTPKGRNAIAKNLTIDETFKASYQKTAANDAVLGLVNEMCVFRYRLCIQTPSGQFLTETVSHTSTVGDLKRVIASKTGIPSDEMRLSYRGKELIIDDKTLEEYGIHDGAITVLLRLRGGGHDQIEVDVLDESCLDPLFNFDFTTLKDDGKKYYRGPHEYHRPYGWMRYALKVKGKYGSDDWLGDPGIRTDTTSSEWSVSYHGTAKDSAKGISKEGYMLSKGENFVYGKGIYSTPSIDLASELYAKPFIYNGDTYKIVFQNRCNPDEIVIIPESVNDIGVYWLVQNEKSIRPYGICIKKIISTTSSTTISTTSSTTISSSDSSCVLQ